MRIHRASVVLQMPLIAVAIGCVPKPHPNIPTPINVGEWPEEMVCSGFSATIRLYDDPLAKSFVDDSGVTRFTFALPTTFGFMSPSSRSASQLAGELPVLSNLEKGQRLGYCSDSRLGAYLLLTPDVPRPDWVDFETPPMMVIPVQDGLLTTSD
jgi:hypothetical protein